jgi:quercetin dioxygenase-like cupin family protein
MRLTTTITLILALAVSDIALRAPTALAGEEPALPHAFDAGWKSQKTCELLFEDDTMRVARCVFPPGVGHEKHYHQPHFGYVLESGAMRIVDSNGERDVTTQAGGSWSSTADSVHEVLNIGDTTASYLIVETVVQ